MDRYLGHTPSELAAAIAELASVFHHYEKIQNIVLPMLEKRQARFHGLAILWALQDHARQIVKDMTNQMQNPGVTDDQIRKGLGQLFFALQGWSIRNSGSCSPSPQNFFQLMS
jgi:DUF438 domain-containing protein